MTPQEQLDKWVQEGQQYSWAMYVENGKIRNKYCGEVKPCKFCGSPGGTDAMCEGCWELKNRVSGIRNISIAYKIKEILDERIQELEHKEEHDS